MSTPSRVDLKSLSFARSSATSFRGAIRIVANGIVAVAHRRMTNAIAGGCLRGRSISTAGRGVATANLEQLFA